MEAQQDCFTCRMSKQADDEHGEPCLLCAMHDNKKVPEYGHCPDYLKQR